MKRFFATITSSKFVPALFVKKKKPPLIIRKGDGGYGYDTTDMAALKYRIEKLESDRIIYVTDSGQILHFQLLFEAGKKAGWLKNTKLDHVTFGVVQGENGKRIKSRSGESIKLGDILDSAYHKYYQDNLQRSLDKTNEYSIPTEDLERISKIISWSALKYADLKQNRINDYQFDFDKMLDNKGDTIVYQLYVWVRIKNIFKKANKNIDDNNYILNKDNITEYSSERELAVHLTQFDEALLSFEKNLLPNFLCEYMYKLAIKFNQFWRDCQVIGNKFELDRLKLCYATLVVMENCFNILGIPAKEINQL